jgi:hypothetical protein
LELQEQLGQREQRELQEQREQLEQLYRFKVLTQIFSHSLPQQLQVQLVRRGFLRILASS